MIIDFHTHIFPPQIKKNRSKYIDTDACFAIMYSSPDSKMVTANELINNMDKEGIDVSVVLNYGWTTHELCVETNDYILESIAKHPKRLVGFCSVQPRSLQAALDEIERCVKGGVKGVGEIRPDMQLLDLMDDEIMQPFIETIIKHNLTMLVHASEPVGHQYPGKGNITPEIIYPLITNFPDLTLVCAHWGGGLPFYSLMPEVKEAMNNVFFDSAASPFLYRPQIYTQVIELLGAEKILFGTDYPLLPPSRLLKEIKSLDLTSEVEHLILAGNAQKLLGLLGM